MSRVHDALQQWIQDRAESPEAVTAERPLLPIEIEQEDNLPGERLRWDRISEFEAICCTEDRLPTLRDEPEFGTEKFRLLQSRLRQLNILKPVKTLVVTSAVPVDGKSLVASNLAVSLAKHSTNKVLLLEGDLHKPSITHRVGLGMHEGFADWLKSEIPLEQVVYRIMDSNVWILPAGNAEENPLRLLQSEKCKEGLAILAASFDWVLIDTPPIMPLADAGFWIQQSDGILLVVREGHTPRRLLQQSLETIDCSKIVGVVLNDTQPTEHEYYTHYYHSDQ